MKDGTPRRPGRPKKYDPSQLKDHGAPKLSIRFDPDLFAFLQEQPDGSRATLEGLVRREASPIRKLALGLALILRELPWEQRPDAGQPTELREDTLQEMALHSVHYAARLLSFGNDDPDAIEDAGKLAAQVRERIERGVSEDKWKMRLLSITLNLSLATSEFFLNPASSVERAKNGLDVLAEATEEQRVVGRGPKKVRRQ